MKKLILTIVAIGLFSTINFGQKDYIVTLKPEVSKSEVQKGHKEKPKKEFKKVINGYVVKLTKSEVVKLERNPKVLFVEEDERISPSEIQLNPSWNLDRLDQLNLPLDNSLTYYQDGTGVDIYIIDSGIRYTHSEFGGRAVFGQDYIGDGQNGNDCYGHGTHVAGLAGGSTYGVAKNSRLISMRIGDCGGYAQISYIIQSLDWIALTQTKPSVANLSYTFSGTSEGTKLAIKNFSKTGSVFVTSSGNFATNACNVSPPNSPFSIAVGATTVNDSFASYSNNGQCVAIWQGGHGILSAGIGDDTQIVSKSGTSMSSPQVAGLVAMYLQKRPDDSSSVVRDYLIEISSKDVIQNLPSGNYNRLAQVPPAIKPEACSFNKFFGALEVGESNSQEFSLNNTSSVNATIKIPTSSSYIFSIQQLKGQSWRDVEVSTGGTLSTSLRRGNYRFNVALLSGTSTYSVCYDFSEAVSKSGAKSIDSMNY